MKKKLLSLLVSIATILSLLPMSALAADTYRVKINMGGIGASGDGQYSVGDEVTLYAGTSEGEEFDSWTLIRPPDGFYLPNENPVTFTMPAGNLIVAPQWKSATYTIMFDAQGGTSVEARQGVEYDTSITSAIRGKTSTREGYAFKGWSKSKTEYQAFSSGERVTGDMTLYAFWNKNYKVIFELESDAQTTVDLTQTVAETGSISLPKDNEVTRDGYILVAWTDGEETRSLYMGFPMPSHDLTLYPVWEPAHKLTLDLNGGSFKEHVADQATLRVRSEWSEISASSVGGLPNNFDVYRDGYELIGWTDGDYRVPIEANSFGSSSGFPYYVMPNHDITLTAVWRPVYSLSYDLNGGTDDYLFTKVYAEGLAVPIKKGIATPPSGKVFNGWSRDGGATMWYQGSIESNENFTMPGEDVTLTAIYKDQSQPTYKVLCYYTNLNGIETGVAKTYRGDEGEEVDVSGFYLYGCHRVEHDDTVETGTVQADGSLTLKLWFELNEYTVEYDQTMNTYAPKNDPLPVPVPDPMIFTARHGDTLTKPADPMREGYTLDTWYAPNQDMSLRWEFPSTTVTRDTFLYPNWKINIYPIRFDTNGGAPMPNRRGGHGYTISESTPRRLGHTFDGWYADPELTDAWDFGNDVITGETTLYAKWAINDYNITFVGGSGGTVIGNTTQSAPYSEFASPSVEAVPENAEWDCIGWAYAVVPDGEEEEMTGVVDDYTKFPIYGDTQFRAVFARRPFAAAVSRGGGYVDLVHEGTPTVGTAVDVSYTYQEGEEHKAAAKCEPRPKWQLSGVTARDLYGHEQHLTLDGTAQTMAAGETGLFTICFVPQPDGTVSMTDVDSSIVLIYEFNAPLEVTFDPAPGTIDGSTDVVMLEYGAGSTLSAAEIPADPASDDYSFGGWYTDPDDESTRLDTTNLPVVNSDIAYYAKWQWKPGKDPSNPQLSGLDITVDNTLIPFAFAPDTYKYGVTLASVSNNMKVKPTAENPDATFQVVLRSSGRPAQNISGPDADGNYIISYDKFIPDDVYYVDVVVSSADGTQSVTYTVAFSIGNVLHLVTDKDGAGAPPRSIAVSGLAEAYPLDKTALGTPIMGVDENGVPKTIQTQTDFFVEVQLRADDIPILAPEVIDQFAAAKTANQVIADYLEFTLHAVVKDKDLNPQGDVMIQPVAGKYVTIQAEIPADSRDGSNYQVLRLHNGKVEQLETKYDSAENTVTFETDKFSPYALTYTPKIAVTPPDPGNSGSSGGSGGSTKYTLTYVSNGGSTLADERYTAGTTVQLTKTPTWPGHQFLGWYADLGLTEQITSAKMTSNKTVYAKWYPAEDQVPGILNGDDHVAYIVGYDDGLVHPTANITRAEVATIFFRLLKDNVRQDNWTDTSGFSDVSIGAWYNIPISTITQLGIVKGRGEGVFDPNANITRAEFAVIAARFDSSPYTGEDKFNDITDSWARDDINRAAQRGWIKGDSIGNFRPDDYITRAETMTLINRVLIRDPATTDALLPSMKIWEDNIDATAWYHLAIQEATNSHEFDRKTDGTEKWTTLVPNRDWATLEQ